MGTNSGAYEIIHECASVFSLIKFTREVKVITIFYRLNKTLFVSVFCIVLIIHKCIKHDSFGQVIDAVFLSIKSTLRRALSIRELKPN